MASVNVAKEITIVPIMIKVAGRRLAFIHLKELATKSLLPEPFDLLDFDFIFLAKLISPLEENASNNSRENFGLRRLELCTPKSRLFQSTLDLVLSHFWSRGL
jgi:hypothetical protein